MAKKQSEKAKLSMAGEFGVASELCKRGFNASVTFGNAKAMDVIIMDFENNKKLYKVVEVKTSHDKKFVTNFFQKYTTKDTPHPDYWVLVYIDTNLNSRYHILTHSEMAMEQMKVNNMTAWAPVTGCDNVSLSNVASYEDSWEKITL